MGAGVDGAHGGLVIQLDLRNVPESVIHHLYVMVVLHVLDIRKIMRNVQVMFKKCRNCGHIYRSAFICIYLYTCILAYLHTCILGHKI